MVLDRVDRLVALLPWLAANQDSSISEVAKRFDVSEKQIVSDIMLLTLTGPDQFGGGLVDIAYEDRFVTVRDSKGLADPVKIKQMEAIPLLIGLKLLETQLPGDMAAEIQTLIEKLSDRSEVQDSTVDSLFVDSMSDEVAKNLHLVNEAISLGSLLSFDYANVESAHSSSPRVVEPRGIQFDRGYQYLTAFDLDKQAQRVFRLDRISNCQYRAKNPQTSPEVAVTEQAQAIADMATNQEPPVTLELMLKPEAANALDDYPSAEVASTEDGVMSVRFPMYSQNWANQVVLSLWPWVIEISPVSVRSAAINALERSLVDHQT